MSILAMSSLLLRSFWCSLLRNIFCMIPDPLPISKYQVFGTVSIQNGEDAESRTAGIFIRDTACFHCDSMNCDQWRSHWGARGAECNRWQRKNCQKSGKRSQEGKIRKHREKKKKNREEQAKIGKFLPLCPTWQMLATLLTVAVPF